MVVKVLYAQDWEAITVIPVPVGLQEILNAQGVCKVPVIEGTTTHWLHIYQKPVLDTKLLWTPDEALALNLDPAWLPGQLKKIQYLQRK
jgi:hypothetical protein